MQKLFIYHLPKSETHKEYRNYTQRGLISRISRSFKHVNSKFMFVNYTTHLKA